MASQARLVYAAQRHFAREPDWLLCLSKSDCSDMLAASCVPEVMVKTVLSYREVLDLRFDSLAIGPGLGSGSAAEILSVIEHAEQPVVVDADAINVLSPDVGLLKHCAGPRLLTPHPGEMERLFPREGRERRQWLDDFLAEYPDHLASEGRANADWRSTRGQIY